MNRMFRSEVQRLALSLSVGSIALFARPVLGQGIPVDPQAASQTPAAPYQSAGTLHTYPLLLSGGDLLELQVFGTPELSGRLRVDQRGDIDLPVGGSLHVDGLTADEAARRIEDRLRNERIMLEPHVTVFVTEYATQVVSVLGQVRRPGPVPLYGSQTLYDVLAGAGGTAENAGGTIAISHRNDPAPPEIIPVRSSNFNEIEHTTQVKPGDTIVVSQADIVYVVGAVNRQGSVPMPNGVPLTLINVLALSSGLNQVAASTKAAIVRQTPSGGVTTIDVNIKRIMHRQDKDIKMEAQDILVVPTSTGKYYAQLILPTVATTAISSAVSAILIR